MHPTYSKMFYYERNVMWTAKGDDTTVHRRHIFRSVREAISGVGERCTMRRFINILFT
jgi:hypothetical protein